MDIIYIIFFVLLLTLFFSYKNNNIENFENVNVNNKVYAKLYNIIFDESKLYQSDINKIIKYTITNNNVKILDAGCGVGRHYQYLSKKYPTIGVDISKELLEYAKVRNPHGKFINDNLVNEKIFEPEEFTHIICLLESLYHNNIDDMDKIIANFYYWLKENGYLCIHIFDRKKLDPGAREFTQYYKDKLGNKHGLTYFNKFTHDAYWKPVNTNSVKYIETVALMDGRKNVSNTILYIPEDNNKIISKMQDGGFKLFKVISVDNENDIELYIFRKIKYKTDTIKL